jgi:predicted AlkP superfamily pyrophosphatase or phosphodiesterase
MPVYFKNLEPRLNELRLGLLLALFLALPGLVAAGQDASQTQRHERTNAVEQMGKPYLVLVSIDGFRWDYPELPETPALDRIATMGMRAEALQPVFPTLTFPNHFSIATGVYPASHGIVANEFPHESGNGWYHYKDRSTVQDGRWYQAEPIWVTAEKQGMLTAAYYFVGTEADVAGIRPSSWHVFDASVSGAERVEQVIEWLSEPPETRPHLLTLYFEDVDDDTHWYGPGSPESLEAIRRVDSQLQMLLDGIGNLAHADEVYLVLLSDHGMAAYSEGEPTLVLDQLVSLEGSRSVEGGTYVFLHFEQADRARAERIRNTVNQGWNCGRALLPDEAPSGWRTGSGGRFPDLLLMADPGCAVISTEDRRGKITPGDHGWVPEMPEMRGIFYAMGPRIPAGLRIGVVQATDVYPLMMSILGLTAPHPMEGDSKWLPSLLLPEQ